MKLYLFILVFSLVGLSDEVGLFLTLNPAGSFSAKSSKVAVKGSLTSNGSSFRAKNISLPIDTLDTGLALRDSHMKKKYFESDKFPEATLVEAEGRNGKFQGVLEVHGERKKIYGIYRMSGRNLETRFKCKMSDFKIKEANYMGIGVEDEVKVSVKLAVP